MAEDHIAACGAIQVIHRILMQEQLDSSLSLENSTRQHLQEALPL